MPEAELRVAGMKLRTWTSLDVSVSVSELTPSFSFTYVNTRPLQAFPVEKHLPCEVHLGGQLALTGHIDRVAHKDSVKSGHTYQVSGRGTTADLVDCSARHGTGRFKNATLPEIAKALAGNHEIEVVIGDEMEIGAKAKLKATLAAKFPKVRMQPGEKVFAVLQKLARDRGAVFVERPDGALVITRSGAQRIRTALERGKNVESWTRADDGSQQYSEYEVLGQRWGSDKWNGDEARGARAVIADETLLRFRPLTMRADRAVDNRDLDLRAAHERNLRAGGSQTLEVEVPGWTHKEAIGPLIVGDVIWRPNRIVRAKNPAQGIDDDYLIVRCDYHKSTERGSVTKLSLAPPETFEPFDPPPLRKLTGVEMLVVFQAVQFAKWGEILLRLKQKGVSRL